MQSINRITTEDNWQIRLKLYILFDFAILHYVQKAKVEQISRVVFTFITGICLLVVAVPVFPLLRNFP